MSKKSLSHLAGVLFCLLTLSFLGDCFDLSVFVRWFAVFAVVAKAGRETFPLGLCAIRLSLAERT